MATKIVFISAKGGQGQTTLIFNLSHALADKGEKVLMVDLDPQGGLEHLMRIKEKSQCGIADVLMGQTELVEALYPTPYPNLQFLPRGRLDPLDYDEFEHVLNIPGLLDRLLHEQSRYYDYILLDVPTNLGLITRGALKISDYVCLPMEEATLAMRTIGQAMRLVEQFRRFENQQLHYLGILRNKVEVRKDDKPTLSSIFLEDFSGVLDTSIPYSGIIAKANLLGKPFCLTKGTTEEDIAVFHNLAEEITSIITSNGKA